MTVQEKSKLEQKQSNVIYDKLRSEHVGAFGLFTIFLQILAKILAVVGTVRLIKSKTLESKSTHRQM